MFIPTGRINLDNLKEYIFFKKILACGGSFMVKEDYINNEEWDKITHLTRKSVDTMLDLKIAHIGINPENESVVKTISNVFNTIMGTDITKESDKSIFAGTLFEVMKYNGVCDNGHIAIKTTNVDRAVYYLSKRGIEFDLSTAMYNDDRSWC